MRMLEEEGYEYEGYVDIFDGGPTMTARTDQVRSIREARCSTVIQTDSTTGQRSLLAAGRLSGFRSCYGLCEAAEDGLVIDPAAAELLGVVPGDEVWTVAR
jgi:arginine N-succinyltransferase